MNCLLFVLLILGLCNKERCNGDDGLCIDEKCCEPIGRNNDCECNKKDFRLEVKQFSEDCECNERKEFPSYQNNDRCPCENFE